MMTAIFHSDPFKSNYSAHKLDEFRKKRDWEGKPPINIRLHAHQTTAISKKLAKMQRCEIDANRGTYTITFSTSIHFFHVQSSKRTKHIETNNSAVRSKHCQMANVIRSEEQNSIDATKKLWHTTLNNNGLKLQRYKVSTTNKIL